MFTQFIWAMNKARMKITRLQVKVECGSLRHANEALLGSTLIFKWKGQTSKWEFRRKNKMLHLKHRTTSASPKVQGQNSIISNIRDIGHIPGICPMHIKKEFSYSHH